MIYESNLHQQFNFVYFIVCTMNNSALKFPLVIYKIDRRYFWLATASKITTILIRYINNIF